MKVHIFSERDKQEKFFITIYPDIRPDTGYPVKIFTGYPVKILPDIRRPDIRPNKYPVQPQMYYYNL